MPACPACGCEHADGGATHAIRGALLDDDADRALTLGLLDARPCAGCGPDCTSTLLAARQARINALAARARFRAREARLARRERERRDRRAPASPAGDASAAPPLPAAAAAALARAKAKAASRR